MKSSLVNNAGSFSSGADSLPRRPPASPSSATTPKKIRRSAKKGNGKAQGAETLTVTEQLFQLLAVVIVAGVVATSGFKSVEWAKQQLKPFCDSANEPVGADADNCVPCPPNGFCQQGRLECVAGFKRISKRCAPDKEIDRTAQKLATASKSYVCGAAARSLCDGASGSVWLPEADLLGNLKKEGLGEELGSGETFYLVWEKTATLVHEENVVIQHDLQGNREFHCPHDVAQGYKPFSCQMKEFFWENALTLFFLSPVVVLVGSFVAKLFHRKKQNTRAQELYVEVCEALEEKALEAKGIDGEESWVVVSRLRDHLLSSSERKNITLWKQVERMVLEDSRIDQYQKKVKGDLKVVWEWQVEGAIRTPGSRKKLQKRTYIPTESPEGTSQQVHGNGTKNPRVLEEIGSPVQL